MPTRRKPRPFTPGQLQAICQVLADTTEGLTGSEIGHVLRQVRVADVTPNDTKWRRLFNALAQSQNRTGSGDRVLAFVSHALEPARYQGDSATLEERRDQVNVTLLLYDGLKFGEDGRFHRTKQASSLPEAQQRANRLRSALERRGVHPDVLNYCSAEFLGDNPFHAVLEATKSVAEKIRKKSGLTSDGARLVQQALAGDRPLLRINALVTDSHRSEQRGFATLLVGMFGTFRNPTAHAPRIYWHMSEKDALDLSPWPRTLTVVSTTRTGIRRDSDRGFAYVSDQH